MPGSSRHKSSRSTRHHGTSRWHTVFHRCCILAHSSPCKLRPDHMSRRIGRSDRRGSLPRRRRDSSMPCKLPGIRYLLDSRRRSLRSPSFLRCLGHYLPFPALPRHYPPSSLPHRPPLPQHHRLPPGRPPVRLLSPHARSRFLRSLSASRQAKLLRLPPRERPTNHPPHRHPWVQSTHQFRRLRRWKPRCLNCRRKLQFHRS